VRQRRSSVETPARPAAPGRSVPPRDPATGATARPRPPPRRGGADRVARCPATGAPGAGTLDHGRCAP